MTTITMSNLQDENNKLIVLNLTTYCHTNE